MSVPDLHPAVTSLAQDVEQTMVSLYEYQTSLINAAADDEPSVSAFFNQVRDRVKDGWEEIRRYLQSCFGFGGDVILLQQSLATETPEDCIEFLEDMLKTCNDILDELQTVIAKNQEVQTFFSEEAISINVVLSSVDPTANRRGLIDGSQYPEGLQAFSATQTNLQNIIDDLQKLGKFWRHTGTICASYLSHGRITITSEQAKLFSSTWKIYQSSLLQSISSIVKSSDAVVVHALGGAIFKEVSFTPPPSPPPPRHEVTHTVVLQIEAPTPIEDLEEQPEPAQSGDTKHTDPEPIASAPTLPNPVKQQTNGHAEPPLATQNQTEVEGTLLHPPVDESDPSGSTPQVTPVAQSDSGSTPQVTPTAHSDSGKDQQPGTPPLDRSNATPVPHTPAILPDDTPITILPASIANGSVQAAPLPPKADTAPLSSTPPPPLPAKDQADSKGVQDEHKTEPATLPTIEVLLNKLEQHIEQAYITLSKWEGAEGNRNKLRRLVGGVSKIRTEYWAAIDAFLDHLPQPVQEQDSSVHQQPGNTDGSKQAGSKLTKLGKHLEQLRGDFENENLNSGRFLHLRAKLTFRQSLSAVPADSKTKEGSKSAKAEMGMESPRPFHIAKASLDSAAKSFDGILKGIGELEDRWKRALAEPRSPDGGMNPSDEESRQLCDALRSFQDRMKRKSPPVAQAASASSSARTDPPSPTVVRKSSKSSRHSLFFDRDHHSSSPKPSDQPVPKPEAPKDHSSPPTPVVENHANVSRNSLSVTHTSSPISSVTPLQTVPKEEVIKGPQLGPPSPLAPSHPPKDSRQSLSTGQDNTPASPRHQPQPLSKGVLRKDHATSEKPKFKLFSRKVKDGPARKSNDSPSQLHTSVPLPQTQPMIPKVLLGPNFHVETLQLIPTPLSDIPTSQTPPDPVQLSQSSMSHLRSVPDLKVDNVDSPNGVPPPQHPSSPLNLDHSSPLGAQDQSASTVPPEHSNAEPADSHVKGAENVPLPPSRQQSTDVATAFPSDVVASSIEEGIAPLAVTVDEGTLNSQPPRGSQRPPHQQAMDNISEGVTSLISDAVASSINKEGTIPPAVKLDETASNSQPPRGSQLPPHKQILEHTEGVSVTPPPPPPAGDSDKSTPTARPPAVRQESTSSTPQTNVKENTTRSSPKTFLPKILRFNKKTPESPK